MTEACGFWLRLQERCRGRAGGAAAPLARGQQDKEEDGGEGLGNGTGQEEQCGRRPKPERLIKYFISRLHKELLKQMKNSKTDINTVHRRDSEG